MVCAGVAYTGRESFLLGHSNPILDEESRQSGWAKIQARVSTRRKFDTGSGAILAGGAKRGRACAGPVAAEITQAGIAWMGPAGRISPVVAANP